MLADKVASVVGSMRFIFIQSTFLIIYVLFQTLSSHPFDPHPFILLNLILSFVAAFQAPFIMMSQNRSADRDREVIQYIKHMVDSIKHVLDSIQKVEKKMDREVKELTRKVEKLERQNNEILQILRTLHEKK